MQTHEIDSSVYPLKAFKLATFWLFNSLSVKVNIQAALDIGTISLALKLYYQILT